MVIYVFVFFIICIAKFFLQNFVPVEKMVEMGTSILEKNKVNNFDDIR